MSIDLQTVRAEVLRRLGDEVGAVWNKSGDPDEIDDYIREGYNQLAIRTGVLWKQGGATEMEDVAGQALYNLPTDFYQLERYMWKQRSIDILTAEDMRRVDERYETVQGEVSAVILDGDGIGVLRKVAVPNESGNNSLMEYFYRPPALVNGTDEFQVPDHFVKYIRFYALWRAYDREGEGQDPVMAGHYKDRFEFGIARVNGRRERVLRRRYGRMGGGARPEGRPPKPRLPWNFPERSR